MNKMKEFVISVIVIVGFVCLLFVGNRIENTYSMKGVVREVTEERSIIEDVTGNLWEVMDNDLIEGEQVKIIFNNNNTDNNRNDDIIKEVKKK